MIYIFEKIVCFYRRERWKFGIVVENGFIAVQKGFQIDERSQSWRHFMKKGTSAGLRKGKLSCQNFSVNMLSFSSLKTNISIRDSFRCFV